MSLNGLIGWSREITWQRLCIIVALVAVRAGSARREGILGICDKTGAAVIGADVMT